MNILVIGGNRFFGKSLVEILCKQKHNVWVYNRGNINVEYPRGAKHIVGDRSDLDLLESSIRDNSIDVVYDQVIFDAIEAQEILDLFERLDDDKLRYIFTSTQSVYGPGPAALESSFESKDHSFTKPAKRDEDYGEAKRQLESVIFNSRFAKQACAPRFPIVIGNDDYTKRFEFHIEALNTGNELFFPNLEASISFIHSDDAAIALYELAKSFKPGPINICAKKPIKLKSFLHLLEEQYDKSFNLGQDPHRNYSPYGIGADWWMDTGEMTKRGIVVKEIPELLYHVLREREAGE